MLRDYLPLLRNIKNINWFKDNSLAVHATIWALIIFREIDERFQGNCFLCQIIKFIMSYYWNNIVYFYNFSIWYILDPYAEIFLFVVPEIHVRWNYNRYRRFISIVWCSNHFKFIPSTNPLLGSRIKKLHERSTSNFIFYENMKSNTITWFIKNINFWFRSARWIKKFGTVEFEFWTVRKPNNKGVTKSFIKKLKIIRIKMISIEHLQSELTFIEKGWRTPPGDHKCGIW